MPSSHGMLKDNMRKPFKFLAMNNVPKGKGWLGFAKGPSLRVIADWDYKLTNILRKSPREEDL